MITAKQAYDLARPNYDEYVKFIEQKITEAATLGKTAVIIREAPYCYWLYNREKPKDVENVLKLLDDNGFRYKLHYYEGQFVDIGLHIFWDTND